MPTTRLVKITTAAPVPSVVTILDGATDTGYNLLRETSWGDAVWEHVDAGVIGTQGRRAASGYPVERQVRVAVRCVGATKGDVDARVAMLDQAADELRQYGGLVTVRENGSAYRMHLEVVRVAGVATAGANDATYRRDVVLDLLCGPFLYGDPLDLDEAWLTDSVAAGEWTVDEGAVVSAGGGSVVVSTTTRLRLTGPGYTHRDVEARLEVVTQSPIGSPALLVALCASTSGLDTMLGAELTSSAIRVVKREAGVATVLATTATSPSAATTYWVVARREGAVVTAEVWASTFDVAPIASATYTLTAAEQAAFVRGHVALRVAGFTGSGLVRAVRVRPYTYRGVALPTQLALGGAVPGTAPALADLHVGWASGGVSGSGASGTYAKTYPVYLLAGWSPIASGNVCPFGGDFIAYASLGPPDPPSVVSIAGVTNVTNATATAGPAPFASTRKYGAAAMEVTTSGALTAQGVAMRIFGEYRKGRVVAALAWARARSGTPSMLLRVRASASADGADSATATLSTTAWTLLSCAWTPSADRQDVWAAVLNPNAVASNYLVDGVCVWECDPAALSASMSSSSSGTVSTITVAATPDSVVAPCLALIESELVYVQSINGTTWTVVRGQEGTTAAAHSAGVLVYALPPSRDHVEGDGGRAPFGVLHAANAALQTTPAAIVSDADYTSGSGSRLDVAADGAWQLGDVVIDPGLVAPDPYTESVDLEVYARIDVDSDWTSLRAAVNALPMAWPLAAPTYSAEYGSAGKAIVRPLDATGLERFAFLGTLTLPVASGPWRLRTNVIGTRAGTARFGLDYYFVVPRRANVRSPEGKTLDTTYPEVFLSAGCTRVLGADGSGAIVGLRDVLVPYHGIGGAPLELPPGNVQLAVKLSNMVPDHPVEASTGADYERMTAAAHLAVTPRYLTVRDA